MNHSAVSKQTLTITVNDRGYELLIAPNKVLLEVLREDLHLTGTKFGCELGECGLCTVLVDGVPTLSCLTLAVLCDGKSVTTVEGLTGDELKIIADAFAEEGASQCGYCTPSMAMMLNYLLKQRGQIDIRNELSGNLCRCTGYVKILRAYEKSLGRAKE
jgi:carbon-monoxide dehydrogenase small subunit